MVLYGAVAAVMLVGLVAELLVTSDTLRGVLRAAVGLGAVVAMALWVRANRVALSCEPARTMITERVIPSGPPPRRWIIATSNAAASPGTRRQAPAAAPKPVVRLVGRSLPGSMDR